VYKEKTGDELITKSSGIIYRNRIRVKYDESNYSFILTGVIMKT
jgi:hypothetical protein